VVRVVDEAAGPRCRAVAWSSEPEKNLAAPGRVRDHAGMKFELLFRQLTPLVLVGLLLVTWLEPWVPGSAWVRANLGEQFLLRFVIGLVVLYILVLWGEALRLHGLLTGTLKAIQQYGQAMGAPARTEPKDPRVRHNLVRLVGKDLGQEPAAWLSWLQQQERAS
jgi:hypothetical protein